MSSLRGWVVVVTGASSGLGREVAYQLAERGCRLVLSARRREQLEETAQGCRERGGQALVVVADVSDEEAVKDLAVAACAQWGRIDGWINNAGVAYFALLADGSLEKHRRVIETNLFGAIHGARAVVPIFRAQRRGVLINIGSVLSRVGNPFVPAYTISKFGLHGLSEVLRVELAEFPDIHVCSLFPYAIGTPHFQGSDNDLGRTIHALPPMQSPERVAEATVKLLERPRRHAYVPPYIALGLVAHGILPRMIERLLLRALERFHLGPPGSQEDGEQDKKDAVHGDRPPRIGTARFFVWAARELLKIGRQTIQEKVQRWREPNTTS